MEKEKKPGKLIGKGEDMPRWTGALFITFTLGLILNSAGAQEPKKSIDVDAIFKKLDTNSDGKLSRDEFLKLADNFKDKDKARTKLTKTFEMIDTSKMGVSIAQFRNYFENARKK
jgi:Ca2+-binding EF-hand superfamily protein